MWLHDTQTEHCGVTSLLHLQLIWQPHRDHCSYNGNGIDIKVIHGLKC